MSGLASSPAVSPPGPIPPRAEHAPTEMRREVQGLRAIAVMLVVVYHLWPGVLPGGYVGVDVFFAISGFLITAHLLREVVRTGRIALPTFWARRVRRLLPASLLVILVTIVATLVWIPSALWTQFLQEAAAASLYVLNWALASNAVDYLAAGNEASLVQHYWSLSVEEQFYLVWPVLIGSSAFAARRLGRSPVASIGIALAVLTSASLLASVWLTATSPATAYFVTHTRAWQFGAGGLLAVAATTGWFERLTSRADGARAALSWAGVAALLWTGLNYDADTPFPGIAAALPVLATLLVITAGTPRAPWGPTRLLAWRPSQFLGDVSYSLYLWHWPPIVVLPFALGADLTQWHRWVILGSVVLLAWLSKRYVEDPIRRTSRWGLRRPRVTFAWMLLTMVLVVGVAVLGMRSAAGEEEEAREVEAIVAETHVDCFGAPTLVGEEGCPDPELEGMVVPDPERVSRDFARVPECWSRNDGSAIEECTFGDPVAHPDVPRVALVGDSHARAMLPALMSLAEDGDLVVDTFLKGSCPWTTAIPTVRSSGVLNRCATYREDLGARLTADPEEWDAILVLAYANDGVMVDGDGPWWDAAMVGYREAWRPALEAGARVVVIRDNPSWAEDSNDCLRTRGRADPTRCDRELPDALGMDDPQVAASEQLAGEGLPTTTIDLTDLYCDDARCPAVIGGANVYRDDHHLTITYTATLAPYLLDRVLASIEEGQ